MFGMSALYHRGQWQSRIFERLDHAMIFVLIGGTATPLFLTCIPSRLGVAAFALMLAGGVVYIVGAILFQGYRPDPRPEVFGYHEVWHCNVCVAAALHYIAIGTLIL